MENRSLNQWAERIGLQAAVVIAGVLIVFGGSALGERIGTREEADMPALTAAEPAEGIGRKPAVQRYLSGAEAEEAVSLPVYDEYVEGEGPAPVWWDPEEPMAAEWEDSSARQSEFNPIQRTDTGCPDYAIEPEVIPAYILDVPLDRYLQEYIHGLCEDCGLPFTLAVAVIEQESHYTPWIISDTDDYGLMQINAVCHGWLSDELGITDFLDPWQNARAGIRILADYYEQIGYVSGALMCYNMGEAGARALFAKGVYSTAYSERVMGIQFRLETEGR